MSHFAVAPFLWLATDRSDDGRLTVSCSRAGFEELTASDLALTAGLQAPWLPRISTSGASAVFELPPGRGVTLGALLPSLSNDERAGVIIGLLKTLVRVWPVGMFPKSGVLCDAEGGLWLVPPFRSLVDGAAKTWEPPQLDEYVIGSLGRGMTAALSFTLMRLLSVPLSAFLSMRTIAVPAPSSSVAWLRPLDGLVTEANEDLLNKREPAADCTARWAATLAVLDDQYKASAPGLGALVSRAWPTVEPQWRWSR